MAKSKKIEEFEEKIQFYQKQYERVKGIKGVSEMMLKQIGDMQKSLKDMLDNPQNDNVSTDTTLSTKIHGIDKEKLHKEKQTQLFSKIEEAPFLDTDTLGTWKDEYAVHSKTTIKESITALEKIYHKVNLLKPNNQDTTYGYGPLNTTPETEIFREILPHMIEDMSNKNVSDYMPKLKYEVVKDDNGNKKSILTIGDLGNASITKWSGNFISLSDENDENELSIPVTNRMYLSGMNLDLQDFLSKINFNHVTVTDADKAKYLSCINDNMVSYRPENPKTLTNDINRRDPLDQYLLNTKLDDSEKVAINLNTCNSMKTNKILYDCNNIPGLTTKFLQELINPVLTSITIANGGIVKFQGYDSMPIVIRTEGIGRIGQLMDAVEHGKIIETSALLSTSVKTNSMYGAKEGGIISIIIQGLKGPFIDPVSRMGDSVFNDSIGEYEILGRAKQQLLVESHAKIGKLDIFTCRAVENFVPVTNNIHTSIEDNTITVDTDMIGVDVNDVVDSI